MKKNTLSLKQSVFATIVIASAFLIVLFTHLQLSREAYSTSAHQIRETYLSLLLAKEMMETKLAAKPNIPAEELASALTTIATKGNLFDHPWVLAKDGSVLYPPDTANPNQDTDQKRIQEILLTFDLTGQWFRPLPTPQRNDSLDVLTPLFAPDGIRFFLKTTVTLDNLKSAFLRTYRFVIMMFFMVVGFAVFLAIRVKRKILDPLKVLSARTVEIANGNLDREISIQTGDEIEDLADSFNQMAKQLAIIKNKAEDANPLTHLPGNNVISSEINKRLRTGVQVAVIHADLDRFKIYNDLYGIQRGDEVIKMTADVLKDAVSEKGAPDDLVAHEGGDDFVVVTTPSCLEGVAYEVIQLFNARIGYHYRQEDRERGGILIADRRTNNPVDAHKVQIPLMSISLAAVTNESQSYPTYQTIANALVGMKKKAKGIRGNSFAVLR